LKLPKVSQKIKTTVETGLITMKTETKLAFKIGGVVNKIFVKKDCQQNRTTRGNFTTN
jgi:hypothetical protein